MSNFLQIEVIFENNQSLEEKSNKCILWFKLHLQLIIEIILKIWLLIKLDSNFHSEFSASFKILAQLRHNWNQQFIHM